MTRRTATALAILLATMGVALPALGQQTVSGSLTSATDTVQIQGIQGTFVSMQVFPGTCSMTVDVYYSIGGSTFTTPTFFVDSTGAHTTITLTNPTGQYEQVFVPAGAIAIQVGVSSYVSGAVNVALTSTASGVASTFITDGINGNAGVAPGGSPALSSQPALVITASPDSAPLPVSGSFSASVAFPDGGLQVIQNSFPWLVAGVDGGPVQVAGSFTTTVAFPDGGIQVIQNSFPWLVAGSDGGAVQVAGTFWQSVQPVSGTVTVTGVSTAANQTNGTQESLLVGLAYNGSQSLAEVTDGGNLTVIGPDGGPLPVTVQNSVAVTGTFWQTTQPISAVSLPLPTLAATSTIQTNGTQESTIAGVSYNGSQSLAEVTDGGMLVVIGPDGGPIPVTGTFWQAVQAVNVTQVGSAIVVTGGVSGSQGVGGLAATGVALAGNPVLVGGSDGTDVRDISTDTSGRINVNINGTVPVSGTFWQTTQPVSIASSVTVTGTVTATSGTAANFLAEVGGLGASGASSVGNPVLVGGAASNGKTYQLLTDTSGDLAVNIENSPTVVLGAGSASVGTVVLGAGSASVGTVGLNAGSQVIGALTANQSVNLAQVGGTTILTAGVLGSQGVGGLAATGGALTGNPVLIAGSDGTDARNLSTNSSGQLNLNNISGTISLPTLAATSTIQTNGTQETQIVQGGNTAVVTAGGALTVTGTTVVTQGQNTTPINAQSAHVTYTSGADVTTGYTSVSLGVSYSGITGSPSGCTIQPETSSDGTNFFSYGPAISISPGGSAAQYQVGQTSSTPTFGLGQATKYVYACSAYPSAGTITTTASYQAATSPIVQVVQPTGSNLNAVITGTVTANAGTNLNTSALALSANQTNGTQETQVIGNGNIGYVTAANAFKVDGSGVTQPVSGTVVLGAGSASVGTVTLGAGSATIGALTANQSVNLAQVAGTSTVTGGVAGSQGVGGLAATGVALAGNPVLVGGSDGTDARNLSTDTSGHLIVEPGNTANSTAWLVSAAQSGTWTVQQGGSWTVAATESGTWTVATNADGSLAGGTAGSKSLAVGGVYNTALPGLTNGQQAAIQLDSSGRVLADISNASLAVTGTFWQSTQPVSIASSVTVTGTVTAISGTAANFLAEVGGLGASAATAVGNPLQIGGVNTNGKTYSLDVDTLGNAYIQGLGTAGSASGGVLTVQGSASGTAIPVSGTVALGAGSATIGALTANQSVNLAQVGGTATVTGGVAGTVGVGGLAATGAALAGDPVLVAGSDGTDARNLSTDTSGHLIVEPGNTANTTAWLVTAASLPLPTGASTLAAQTAVQTTLTSSVGTNPGTALLMEGLYETSAPSPSNNQAVALQVDSAGNLKVNVEAGTTGGGGGGGTVAQGDAGSQSWLVNVDLPIAQGYNVLGAVSQGGVNLLEYSQAVATAPWTIAVNTVATPTATNNAATAPDGSVTATAITVATCPSAGNISEIYQRPSAVNQTGVYTFSVWMNAGSAQSVGIWIYDVTASSLVASATESVTTAWQRFYVTSTSISSGHQIQAVFGNNNGLVNAGTSSFNAWGEQLEQGSFPGPYEYTTWEAVLPTSTNWNVAGTVTLGAGSATIGALTANQSVNLAQVGSNAVATGGLAGSLAIGGMQAAGAVLVGNPVVVAGSDGTDARDLSTDTSGHLIVEPGNTANSTAWLVTAANINTISSSVGTNPASAALGEALYESTPPAATNNQAVALQANTAGRLLVATSGVPTTPFSAIAATGTATSTADMTQGYSGATLGVTFSSGTFTGTASAFGCSIQALRSVDGTNFSNYGPAYYVVPVTSTFTQLAIAGPDNNLGQLMKYNYACNTYPGGTGTITMTAMYTTAFSPGGVNTIPFNVVSATASANSFYTPDNVSGMTSAQLSLAWSSSLTGSPSNCAIQAYIGDALNQSAVGVPIGITPAVGTPQQIDISTALPAMSLGQQISYSYTCSTYPSAGTLTMYAHYSSATRAVQLSDQRIFLMQNTTITASGSTIVRGNFGATQFAGKDVELYFDVVGTVSGTSPTLSFTAEEVAPYASSSQLVGQSVTTANAIATSTHYTISLPSVTSDALEIAWTIGGSATPTFNGVYVTIVSKPHSTNIRPGGVNTYAATTAAGIATGTSAATVDICQIWHPATDLQTAEVEKIFINTSATGTVSGIETVTIYPITTEGTSCGSTPSISKADQGEPGSSVVVNTACTASTVRGTAFQSAIFPAGAVGSATNPQGVIWWDGTREFGRPLTMRAGVAEGWEVAVTYGTAPSGAQSFNCGWVWQEK